jgi:hydrogenase/urease accessory protein HupE
VTRVSAAVAVLLAFAAKPGAAHDVDVTGVARVFIDQVGEQTYALSIVDLQVPPLGNVGEVLPPRCAPVESPEVSGVVPGFRFECDSPLNFDDVVTLPWDLEGVVALARWSDGSEASAFFRGEGGRVELRMGDLGAGSGSRSRLAGAYLLLGAEHILLGIDHLLFLLGLLLLVRGPWSLVKTVTAFTIAHSITLGAAVLGYIPVATGPVEAAIALSIVLLAREVVMGYRGHESLVHRKPWIVAFVFGLLHGLGFAGALGELGLNAADIPLALFFFNVGVEAGQLAFVAVVVAARQVLRRRATLRAPWFQPALGYALGALATFWFLERLPAVWGGG